MTTDWDWHYKSQTVAYICGFQGSFVCLLHSDVRLVNINTVIVPLYTKYAGFSQVSPCLTLRKTSRRKHQFLIWKTSSCEVFQIYPIVEGMPNRQADFVLGYMSWLYGFSFNDFNRSCENLIFMDFFSLHFLMLLQEVSFSFTLHEKELSIARPVRNFLCMSAGFHFLFPLLFTLETQSLRFGLDYVILCSRGKHRRSNGATTSFTT